MCGTTRYSSGLVAHHRRQIHRRHRILGRRWHVGRQQGRLWQRLGLGVVQPQQHAVRFVALAAQHQPLGQAQARQLLQGLRIRPALGQQPLPQRCLHRLGVAARER